MKNRNVPRIIAVILAAIILVSAMAVTVVKLMGGQSDTTSENDESISESSESSEEISSDLSSESSEETESEDKSFTLSELYTDNLAENLLESHTSTKVSVTLYLPDEVTYNYTTYVSKEENGYYYHYIDDDGSEQMVRKNEIYALSSDESVMFQVAYDEEYNDNILPYILTTNPYYYESTETVVDCTEEDGVLYLKTNIDLSQDEYYSNNWGYTEGTADCLYVIDSETLAIQSVTLSLDGETMSETVVELDGEDFSDTTLTEKLQEATSYKDVTLYYDYGGENEVVYNYSLPDIASFYYTQPTGYTMYIDPDGTEPLSSASGDDERLSGDSVTLYLIADSEE